MLEKMHATSFDWLSWSGGGLTKLGVANRYEIIKTNKHIIKKFAIGYLEGEDLLCRPKVNETAIMFLKDDEVFWTHITNTEFTYLFSQKE